MVVSIANHHMGLRARGAATQNRILEKAVHIASIEGLSSMSLATLAKATSMSKSGLFAHFRSKEALQIAIIDEAERIFTDLVVRPSQQSTGAERVDMLVHGYVDYCARGPFQGGCFFAAAAHEFDGRPGPVRDRVMAFYETWGSQVRVALQEAQQKGQLRDGVDANGFVFELVGIGLSANCSAQLGGGAERAKVQAKEAAKSLLDRFLLLKN